MIEEYVIGKFVEENKGRFLCTVCVEGVNRECHVSSSSRLGQYVDLSGKMVLLRKNKGKNLRTEFTLYAAELCGSRVLLDFNYVNECMWEYFASRENGGAEVCREKRLGNHLKTDITVGEHTHHEVKAILSEGRTAVFPDRTKRLYRQLLLYRQVLRTGERVEFDFVVLNPRTEEIRCNRDNGEILRELSEAVKLGMAVNVFVMRWHGGRFRAEPDERMSAELKESLLSFGGD